VIVLESLIKKFLGSELARLKLKPVLEPESLILSDNRKPDIYVPSLDNSKFAFDISVTHPTCPSHIQNAANTKGADCSCSLARLFC
jgi:hypothetical protein